jgi:hypothetical protein
MLDRLRSLAALMSGKTRKPDRLDAPSHMSIDRESWNSRDLIETRAPASIVNRLDELERLLKERPLEELERLLREHPQSRRRAPSEGPNYRKEILCGWTGAGLGRLSFHTSMEAIDAVRHLRDRCRDHRPGE